MTEHLLNANRYERLTKEEARHRMYNARGKLIRLTLKNKALDCDSADGKYFHRSIHLPNMPDGKRKKDRRIPQFYGLPKVHKNPWKLQPVVSTVGATMEIMSKWLDFQLQKVVTLCPSYLRDSWQLLEEIKQLGPLPRGSKLVTADAVAMYPNIDTDHGLKVVRLWLYKHQNDEGFPADLPIELICEGLELVMKNNIFQFDDCYFHQQKGTAIGTSVACAYSTIYFSYHEEEKLPAYGAYILFYKRFIDDLMAVIVPGSQTTAT